MNAFFLQILDPDICCFKISIAGINNDILRIQHANQSVQQRFRKKGIFADKQYNTRLPD